MTFVHYTPTAEPFSFICTPITHPFRTHLAFVTHQVQAHYSTCCTPFCAQLLHACSLPLPFVALGHTPTACVTPLGLCHTLKACVRPQGLCETPWSVSHPLPCVTPRSAPFTRALRTHHSPCAPCPLRPSPKAPPRVPPLARGPAPPGGHSQWGRAERPGRARAAL